MLHFISLLVLPSLVASAVISSADTGIADGRLRIARKEDGKWKVATKFLDCLGGQEYSEMVNCVGVRAVAALNRASRMSSINLLPGITLTVDPEAEPMPRSGRALSEEEIENSISSDPNEKGFILMDMFADSFSRFLQTHSLQLRLPKSDSSEWQRALHEGRAKLKKKWLPYLGILAVKLFAVLPLAMGAIGFLALKALIASKIALVIAGILAVQKYSGSFSGFSKLTDSFSGSASSYSPVVSSPAAGYYRRSIEDQAAAQQLAYSVQQPQQVSPLIS